MNAPPPARSGDPGAPNAIVTPVETSTADDRRFFFVHVMKTAGTTLAIHLQQQFHGAEIYPCAGIDRDGFNDAALYVYASVRHLLALPPERRAAIRLYSGHFPYVASQLIEDDVSTLTLLRDPVDRTISALKHFKRLHARYRDLSLEEIYDDEFIFSVFVDNHQTRIFAVTPDDQPDAFSSSLTFDTTLVGLSADRGDDVVANASASSVVLDEDRFAIAKANLAATDVVGLTSDYPEFVEELRRRFGWWPAGLDTVGRANVSEEAWEAPAGLRERIAADNAFDVAFYRFAEELVAARRDRAGDVQQGAG